MERGFKRRLGVLPVIYLAYIEGATTLDVNALRELGKIQFIPVFGFNGIFRDDFRSESRGYAKHYPGYLQ